MYRSCFLAPAPVGASSVRFSFNNDSRLTTTRHRRMFFAAPTHSIRAVISPSPNPLNVQPTITVDKSGQKVETPMKKEVTEGAFSTFINLMPGLWNSQRTYHYTSLDTPAVEPSKTTFEVTALQPEAIDDVLQRNESATTNLHRWQLDVTYGFRVTFRTKMASSDQLVIAGTNLAFVPHAFHDNGIIRGDYFRDLGYEEKAPIKASFVFDAAKLQLVMTTVYTKVVSVDSITLVNPSTRLRQIVNYHRPQNDGAPLADIALVGFGLETRGDKDQRLVE